MRRINRYVLSNICPSKDKNAHTLRSSDYLKKLGRLTATIHRFGCKQGARWLGGDGGESWLLARAALIVEAIVSKAFKGGKRLKNVTNAYPLAIRRISGESSTLRKRISCRAARVAILGLLSERATILDSGDDAGTTFAIDLLSDSRPFQQIRRRPR